MITTEVQRTLVKSPPELWAELSDPTALARHLGELGEVRVTRVEPEELVEWESDSGSRGSVMLKASGWGTRVTLQVLHQAGVTGEASEEGDTVEAVDTVPEQETTLGADARGEIDGADAAGEAVDAHLDPAPEEAAGESPIAEPEPAGAAETVDLAAREDPAPEADDAPAAPPDPVNELGAPATAAARAMIPSARAEMNTTGLIDTEPEPAPPAEPPAAPTVKRRGLFARLRSAFGIGPLEDAPLEASAPTPAPASEKGTALLAAPEAEAGWWGAFDPAPVPTGAADDESGPDAGEFPRVRIIDRRDAVAEPAAEPVAESVQSAAEAEPDAVSDSEAPSDDAQPEPATADGTISDLQLAADDAESHAPAAEAPADPAAGIADELRAAEEAAEARVTAVLTAVLDRLGAAHHRPFSRS